MGEFRALGGKIITKPFVVLGVFVLIAGLLLLKRLIFGIGAVTNMSDGYPWGIWIAYDVVVGTALACGGYAVALLVYIMNKREYHPLIRSALLASMFGYTLAGISIFFDIGRYWQFYNMFLPWQMQFNSIMLEVALCISSYIMVLWIEFSPSFLEGFNQQRLKRALNKVLFVFIAVGVLLPTMHQSSLGSLLLIAGQKVSPLWQTGLLPLLFLLSAIAMGFAVVSFESVLSSVGFRRPFELPVLARLAGLMPKLIALYLAVRFGDLLWRGQLGLAFAGDFKGVMFIVENILYVIPLVMLLRPLNRQRPKTLFFASLSLLMAGSVYRFNAYLVGFDPGAGWSYFPSFSETMITFGIIAFEIMAYLVIVKKLPVLPAAEHA